MRNNRGNPFLLAIFLGIFFIYNLKRYAIITASSIVFALILAIFAYIGKHLLTKLKYNNAEISFILLRLIITPFFLGLVGYIIYELFQMNSSRDTSILPKIAVDSIFISVITYTIFAMIFEVFIKLDISIAIWNKPKSRQINSFDKIIIAISICILIFLLLRFSILILPFCLIIFDYLYLIYKTGYKAFHIPIFTLLFLPFIAIMIIGNIPV